jgi:hypothetical protein
MQYKTIAKVFGKVRYFMPELNGIVSDSIPPLL